MNTLRWSCEPRIIRAHPFCSLCHLWAPDDMSHILSCPALISFHSELNMNVHRFLVQAGLRLPLTSDPVIWVRDFVLASSEVVSRQSSWQISWRQLSILAHRYAACRPNEPSPKQFSEMVDRLSKRFRCQCHGRHSCDLKNCWITPIELVSFLAREFNLQVEGCADPLHLTDTMPRYVSGWEEDKFFGAEHDVLSLNLEGTNTYINPPFSLKKVVDGKPTHMIAFYAVGRSGARGRRQHVQFF